MHPEPTSLGGNMHVLFTTVQIAPPSAALNAATHDPAAETKIGRPDAHNHLTSEPSVETHRDVDEGSYADLADPDCADWT